jgi:hypothetical protein
MDLPDGYAFRAPTPDYLEAVADVLVAERSASGAMEAALDATSSGKRGGGPMKPTSFQAYAGGSPVPSSSG